MTNNVFKFFCLFCVMISLEANGFSTSTHTSIEYNDFHLENNTDFLIEFDDFPNNSLPNLASLATIKDNENDIIVKFRDFEPTHDSAKTIEKQAKLGTDIHLPQRNSKWMR